MDDELREIRERKIEELRKRFDPPNPVEMPKNTEIITLTTKNFTSVLAGHPHLIIDFWAPWCGPCRVLTPIIEDLAAKFAGKVRFAKCNTDENQQIAYQYGISAIPTLFFCINGQVVNQVAGVLPRPQIEQLINEMFTIT